MQRAYDQVVHDIAIQNLNVVLCLDRGGLVGADGPTHHGVYDLAYFRCIPNMTISAPMNEEELRNLMYTAQQDDMGPFVIRYPRGNGVFSDWKRPMKAIEVGTGRKLRSGLNTAILSIGPVGNFALEVSEEMAKNAELDTTQAQIEKLQKILPIILGEFLPLENVSTDVSLEAGFLKSI